MSVLHRETSIRDANLRGMGIDPPDWSDLDSVRATKKQELGVYCSRAIYAGFDLGGSHYSMTEHDQTELMAQLSSIQAGAASVPYHADGELCRMYPAEEFAVVGQHGVAHVLYHRTYCNHLNAWVNRSDFADMEGIYYGAALPEDLAASMAALLAEAGGAKT